MRRNLQKVVSDYLRDRGFCVASNDLQTAKGIDIVAVKNNVPYLIEVKSAIFDKGCFKVKALNKSGLASEYIAIVTPKMNIIFQTIEEHLKLCAKNGDRSVTKIVRIYDSL